LRHGESANDEPARIESKLGCWACQGNAGAQGGGFSGVNRDIERERELIEQQKRRISEQ